MFEVLDVEENMLEVSLKSFEPGCLWPVARRNRLVIPEDIELLERKEGVRGSTTKFEDILIEPR